MERKANYLLVGIFTLVLIASGVGFVMWASKHRDGSEVTRYLIYFDGAVNGLAKGSVVRFLGVNVGQVEDITLDTQPYLRVKVLAAIESRVPVSTSTIASLKPQGLTGVSFIDLRAGRRKGEPLTPNDETEKYPVIASEASDLDKLVSGVPELIDKAQNLMDRAGALFNDENIAAFSGSLRNIDQITASIAENSAGLAETLKSLQAASLALEGAMSDDKLGKTLESAAASAESLQAIAERVDALIKAQESNVGQSLTDVRALIQETRQTARSLSVLARQMQEEPTRLLYPKDEQGVKIAP